jgi:DNA-binding protein H-NS
LLDEDLKYRSPSIAADISNSAIDMASMSVDHLWTLHQQLEKILVEKITVELNDLRRRLALLKPEVEPYADQKVSKKATSHRRPYPAVQPKYRNPDSPSETWAGRGRQPRWLIEQLGMGKRLEDLLI